VEFRRISNLPPYVFKLIDEQRLDPATLGVPQYLAWVARYPRQQILYRNFFEFVLSHNQSQFGEDIASAYERAFPNEPEFPVEARATLAARRGTPADAIAVYERSFRPLWDPALVTKFFALLKQSNGLRADLERARTAVTANPVEIAPAAKLFYYWQQQGNVLPGERALIEFRQLKEARKSPWTADELLTLGRLFELSHNYDEAARNYYAMYAAAGADNAAAETALASLTRLLISLPEQPIRFGAANLALYRDVATMDPHPGFLNGILSLILNNTDPAFPGFPNQGSQGSNRFSGVIAWRSTLTPRMVNELRGQIASISGTCVRNASTSPVSNCTERPVGMPRHGFDVRWDQM
jgi:hypothetical protein